MKSVEDQIADIEAWDRATCLSNWTRLTNQPVAKGLSTRFLRRALIFELQCKELGGQSASVRRALRSANKGNDGSKNTSAGVLSSGTQLVREWNGRLYRVNVIADGYEMDGQIYASLSAVAKRITGAHWSGPRFFGVNGNAA